jgi:hypothetical protein
LLHITTLKDKHTYRGRNPLDEGSASRRDLYLTTHNTHKRKIFVSLAEFKRPQNHRHQRKSKITLRYIVKMYLRGTGDGFVNWILDTSGKGQCPVANIFKQVLTTRKLISSEAASNTNLQPVVTQTTSLSGTRAKRTSVDT